MRMNFEVFIIYFLKMIATENTETQRKNKKKNSMFQCTQGRTLNRNTFSTRVRRNRSLIVARQIGLQSLVFSTHFTATNTAKTNEKKHCAKEKIIFLL